MQRRREDGGSGREWRREKRERRQRQHTGWTNPIINDLCVLTRTKEQLPITQQAGRASSPNKAGLRKADNGRMVVVEEKQVQPQRRPTLRPDVTSLVTLPRVVGRRRALRLSSSRPNVT